MIEQLATIGFKADTKDITRARDELGRFVKSGADADKATAKATSSMGRSFGALAASVTALVSVSGGMTKLVDVARQFDVLNAGLITATGSAEKAAEAFKALEDFATQTPYSLNQAVEGFTKLVNLGLTPSEAALRSYGNTAAAMGKDLSQMIEAVADATTGEFERLKEFGIKAKSEGDRVTFTFRGVSTEIGKNAAEIESYLMALGENEFAGAMANRMATLDGAISNLADSWDGLFRTISASGAGDAIAESVRAATAGIENLDAMISSGQLSAGLDSFFDQFKAWGADVAALLDIVTGLFNSAANSMYIDFHKSAMLIGDVFFDLPKNIRAMLQIATVEISAYVDGVGVYMKKLVDMMNPVVNFVDVEKEFERIATARQKAIVAIMDERSAAQQMAQQSIAASEQLRKRYDEEASSVDRTTDRLAQYKAVVTQTAQAQGTLTKYIQETDEVLDAHFDAVDELEEIYMRRSDSALEAFEAESEYLEGLTQKTEEYASVSEKAAERIEEAFADAWLNAFDGMKSVVDGMKNALKRMLAEMAHMALTKPIMVSLGLGGLLPSGASAAASGAASSGGSALGSAASSAGLFGGISAGIMGAGNLIGGSFGAGLTASGGLLGAGSIGTMFSGSASLIGSGNVAAGLGMAMPLIIGGVLAAMGVNKLTGGGLFGTSFKTTGQSLDLMLGGGDVTGSTTTEESRKRSLFRGTKRRTTTSAFDASEIDAAFDSITSALGQAAKTFGIEGADAVIKGFSASVNINIKDKTQEEIQAAIQQWVGSTADALVNAVFGDSLTGLQKEGEGVIDTVNRLAANMQSVQAIAKGLGLDFGLTGKAAMVAATNIVELAGGLDSLAQLSSQYYQSFYSEAERQLMLQSDLTAAFKALGVEMPTTREGFRALVDGLDLSTEAGQKLFAELMKLVPGMDQYLAYLERGTESVDDAAEALRGLSDAAGATKSAAQAAFSALERAASAQRQQYQDAAKEREAAIKADYAIEVARIDSLHDARIEQLTAESEAAKAAHDMQMKGLNSQRDAAQASLANVRALSDMLRQATGVSLSYTEAQAQLRGMVSSARMGALPSQGSLSAVLQGLSAGPNASSAADLAFQQAVTANQLKELGGFVDTQLSVEERTLEGIESQIEMATVQHDETMLALEKQIEEAKAKYQLDKDAAKAAYEQALELSDKQLMAEEEALNLLVAEAQKQLNALLGIDDRILSMTEALTAFGSAVSTARDAQNAYERSLMEQNAVNAQNNAKVAELLTKIATESEKQSAAAISTAKHTATTAQVLELDQFERLEASA